MSKQANAGELRTPIEVHGKHVEKSNGFAVTTWPDNVFGVGKTIRCKWVNFHGTEVLEAATLQLIEPATLTMRYSPLITPECHIFKGEAEYEIISLDDVEDLHQWLEIKVKRAVTA